MFKKYFELDVYVDKKGTKYYIVCIYRKFLFWKIPLQVEMFYNINDAKRWGIKQCNL